MPLGGHFYTAANTYKGKQHMLHVGATNIRLTRAAKPKRKDHTGKRVAPEPGEAIEARLIITVVKDNEEKTIARWSLISNVAAEIDATERSEERRVGKE